LEIGTSEGYHPASMKDHYRTIYYEAPEGIKDHFEQPGYQVYRNLDPFVVNFGGF